MLSDYQFAPRKIILPAILLSLIIPVVFFNSCSKKNTTWKSVDPAYARYVEAYTTGIVSKTSGIERAGPPSKDFKSLLSALFSAQSALARQGDRLVRDLSVFEIVQAADP